MFSKAYGESDVVGRAEMPLMTDSPMSDLTHPLQTQNSSPGL